MSVYSIGVYTPRHGTVLFLPLWSWVLPVGETRAMPWDSVPLFPPPHDSFRGRWELELKQDTRDRYCHRFESFLQLSRAQEQQFGNVSPLCLLSPASPFRKEIQSNPFWLQRILLYQSGFAASVTSMTETFKRKRLRSLRSSVPLLSRSNLKLEIFYIINPPVSKILITAHD